MKGNCSNCDRRLSHQNKKGVCRSCFASELGRNRELVTSRTERVRALRGDPQYETIYLMQRKNASRSRLDWCPLEYRAEYFSMRRSKKLPAAEARALIEDLMARDLQAYLATGRLQRSAAA